MSEEACTTYGYEPSEKLHEIFHEYHKTHNDAVFDCYTPEMRLARRNKIVTGLPDTYGRGRIAVSYTHLHLCVRLPGEIRLLWDIGQQPAMS